MINRTQPKVSIVIPSYNQGQFIKQTIDSILEQDYLHIEIIVCDGGSTDETVEVLKSYGKRIHWVSEKDKGQTDAINKGLKKASGEILAYLNSDDYLLPGAVTTVVDAFEKCPHHFWLTGNYRVVNAKGNERDGFIIWYKSSQRKLMQWFSFLQPIILGINNPLIQPSTFWRSTLLKEIGNFNAGLRFTMDYDFWWRALKNTGGPIFLDQKLSVFRVHGLAKGGHSYLPQVNEQYEVAKSHGVHPLLLLLQKVHSAIYTFCYSLRRM